MKKFFRFSIALVFSALLGISFLYSCSPDSVESETVKTATSVAPQSTAARLSATSLNTAQQMHQAMTQTTAWVAYATSRNSFATHMNANTVFFTSKAAYMSWINSNLSSTTFQSTRAFEIAFDDMTGKYQVLMNQNPALFNYISNADPDQFFPIMQSGLDPAPIATSNIGCYLGCFSGLASAYEDAINNYGQDMAAIKQLGFSNLASAAESRFKASLNSANAAFNTCMGGC